MTNERTPLLGSYAYGDSDEYASVDEHAQFCMLVGIPSSAPDADRKHRSVPPKSLYGRVTRQLRSQRWTYYTTASLSNILLLSQVMLGAALTALGASESSHILITVFGAMNTVIAGLVAYLKSRGQPMRARMYRDDLERVVDEIENSEVMWLGITRHVHGYDEIDTDDGQVSVRSEVARLTRLYDRAVKSNTMNNPDMYMAGGGFDGNGAQLRSRPQGVSALPITPGPQPIVAAPVLGPSVPAVAGPAPAQNVADPDESPATAAPKPKEEPKEDKKDKKDDAGDDVQEASKEQNKDTKEGESSSASKAPAAGATQAETSSSKTTPVPQQPDPDAAPATDPKVPLKKD
ncbi:hypothetical protein PV05_01544 [Exophiala xenobiotica]|uniref:SMODS and SLOG-associating 2TM effector domain-containing protein n=1 Tax=Exophiala xenobiotica TaxID=348802 RepID=A0A0D2F0I2_9EURO|nr:uncharacterized protein PV05_01544 [Exophiala xenobiotica]KIW61423.1 hypothetical protein PV05_01544 [Exophiala xenobiotica]